jgi:uncharacterized protein YbjT (DUF2867 family)
MDRNTETILVTGSTGHQGGAAARHLLAEGWHVRALVRDPSKPAALGIERAGAELVVGDLLDRSSLDRAAAGVYGVYSVQTFRDVGLEGEVAEGVNLADAAKAAGARHLVYSSVRGAGSPSEIPFVQSKQQIEAHIRQSGIPATIWRPVTFMENFLYQKDGIVAGTLQGPEPPDAMKQMIAVDDIGRFVALAFSDPQRFVGTTMEIASDEMTWAEVASTLQRVLDRPVAYEQTPGAFAAPAPGAADLTASRALIPDLMRFEDWVRALGWIA